MKRDLYSLVHEGFFPLEDGSKDEVSKADIIIYQLRITIVILLLDKDKT